MPFRWRVLLELAAIPLLYTYVLCGSVKKARIINPRVGTFRSKETPCNAYSILEQDCNPEAKISSHIDHWSLRSSWISHNNLTVQAAGSYSSGGRGGAVDRLTASHPCETGSIPGGVAPGYCVWDPCRTMPLDGGFCRGSLVFLRPSIHTSLHPLKTSLLRAVQVQISPLLTTVPRKVEDKRSPNTIHMGPQRAHNAHDTKSPLESSENFLSQNTHQASSSLDRETPGRSSNSNVPEDTLFSSSMWSPELMTEEHPDLPKMLMVDLAISTLASHQGDPGSIPGRVTGSSQVGIVPDDAVGGQVFSGISRFTPPPKLRRRSIFTSIALIGSQDLADQGDTIGFASLWCFKQRVLKAVKIREFYDLTLDVTNSAATWRGEKERGWGEKQGPRGETGVPSENKAGHWQRPPRFPRVKIRVNPPRIEPGSPWWEAS
ncbi:hypothetical protein PR048_025694 [Dryococelus australis]|uniref:Uncharacterized protein n=1 Tax=Dryococelus australis TaxID=614101 RepID=A0ABQ9GJA6_9NEOP|nr:hypothetical protein PR048_025694 [Dryococelus australis]